jgi:excisionase family DNA binding protein
MVGKSMFTNRKTISIMKACELVGVSRRTIYNWIAGEKVEYVRTAGGSIRIFVDTLWRKPEEPKGRQSTQTGVGEQQRLV